MKFLLVALASCLCLAVAAATKLADQEGFYYEQRPRLGHFKDRPFIDLYKTYAAAFILPLNPERDPEDNRNYLPSADECVTFFRKFRIDDYRLKDIDDFVVLDACLGYLYESTYHEKDSQFSNNVAQNLPQNVNDDKLKAIYTGTTVNSLSIENQGCIGDLFLNAIRAKHQFPDVVCNNDWINLFNAFAECQKSIPQELRATDSYLQIIYELVKRRGTECFHNEIRSLDEAIRGSYVNSPLERVGNFLTSPFSSIRSQAKDRIWNHKLTDLLAAVQGTEKKVNLREVNLIIRGINTDEPAIMDRLLYNMAKYADAKIKPKKDKETRADPTGINRYDDLVDHLCNFFRQSDSTKFYDYSTPFVRMLKMLEYPDIFGISREYFLNQVLIGGYETAPLYLSICSCNVLAYTEGAFVQQPQNSPLHYRVVFKADTSLMPRWPDAGYY